MQKKVRIFGSQELVFLFWSRFGTVLTDEGLWPKYLNITDSGTFFGNFNFEEKVIKTYQVRICSSLKHSTINGRSIHGFLPD